MADAGDPHRRDVVRDRRGWPADQEDCSLAYNIDMWGPPTCTCCRPSIWRDIQDPPVPPLAVISRSQRWCVGGVNPSNPRRPPSINRLPRVLTEQHPRQRLAAFYKVNQAEKVQADRRKPGCDMAYRRGAPPSHLLWPEAFGDKAALLRGCPTFSQVFQSRLRSCSGSTRRRARGSDRPGPHLGTATRHRPPPASTSPVVTEQVVLLV